MPNNPIFGVETEEWCTKCGLHEGCVSPFMKVTGEGKEKILIVAEAPGKEEDEYGAQLVGKSGKTIRGKVKLLDYDLDIDFWKTNALICRPPGNKTPTDGQIKLCYNELEQDIKFLKPKAIIALGGIAVKSLMKGRGNTTSINSLSGTMIPLPEYNCWMFPLFHPSYLNRNQYDLNLQTEFDRTLKDALKKCRDLPELPKLDMHKMIHSIEDPDEIGIFIDDILNNKLRSAVDFETSGLNPFVEGHRTFTVAITLEDMLTYTFPIDYPGAWNKVDHMYVKDCLKDYLEGSNPKIAQNSQYEMAWTKQVLKVFPNNFDWDTMTTQHLIDNRAKITGLKHQAFVRYGIQEYDKAIKPFIKTIPGTNFNQMHKAPLPLLLLYNGMDSYITMQLYHDQRKELLNEYTQKFFNKGLYTFNKLSENGICIDSEYYTEKRKELTEEIVEMLKEIHGSKEVKSFEKKYGEFSIASPPQLQKFLFDHLELESTKMTAKGNRSVDAEALGKMDHWIPEIIIKTRKLTKLKDTFLAQFENHTVNGKVHSNFGLGGPRSYRSSSRSPNLHNTPKRDKRAKKTIRGGLIPSPGNKLVEIDFSGIEVTTSALYHKDPTFINYLLNDNADMHRDNAADLWKLKASEVTKDIRFYAKNCWTFPQFYGDWYSSCAESLWEHRKLELEDGKPLVEHLKDNKIISYQAFENHCKKMERKLWYERFPVYTQWKKDINTFYQKYGYVETYMGFRFTGYMDKKQVANYPIQGTAFHILLWCLNKLNTKALMERWLSKFVNEIHDSMVNDLNPKEKTMVLNACKEMCEKTVVDRFDWITLPFHVDMEISKKDGSLADMRDLNWN